MLMRLTRYLVTLLLLSPGALSADDAREQLAFFENSVRPVLVQNCQKCH